MRDDLFLRRLVDFCEDNVGAFDFQEAVISAIFREVVNKGDVVVDGGAHAGRHTSTLADLAGEGGKVFAIEPLPSLSANLTKRFQNQSNVIVMQKALSDSEGTVSFSFVKNNPSYSGFQVSDRLGNAEISEINVETVKLDSILEGEEACRLIKLDLEGAEFMALTGATKILQGLSPMVLFENDLKQTACRYGYERELFFDIFIRSGYRFFDISGSEVSALHWENQRPHFDNFIAVKRKEDLSFITERLPEVLASVLLEMNEVSVNLTKSIFTIMGWRAGKMRTVLFGAGNRAKLILEKCPLLFSYVVDNDSGKWGRKFCGMNVFSPQKLLDEKNAGVRIAVISLFGVEMERQLLDMGFPPDSILRLDIR